MVTVVWGQWYLRAHLALNLPSLLAYGNLPRFCECHDMSYIIVTRAADVPTIDTSPAIHALRQFMTVEIRTIPESEIANPIETHQRIWSAATTEAKSKGTFVLFMPPDVAWSDGSFAHLAELLSAGRRLVFMTYLRVVAETFVPAVLQRSNKPGSALRLPPRELVDMAMHHVHPLMAAHMRDSPYFPYHPEMVVWPVRDEGILVRCLARELFLFDPQHMALSRQLLASEEIDRTVFEFVDNSDNLFAVSLAPLGKDAAWHLKAIRADEAKIANWWLAYDSPMNDLISSFRIRWHWKGVTKQRWHRAELVSDRWVRRLAATREGLRVWNTLIDTGNWEAASLVAAAIRLRALPRSLRNAVGTAAIVFIPPPHAVSTILEARRKPPVDAVGLQRILQRYIVLQKSPRAIPLEDLAPTAAPLLIRSLDGTYLTVKRTTAGITVAGSRVIAPYLRSGNHLIYLLDGLLEPRTGRPKRLENLPNQTYSAMSDAQPPICS